METGKENVRFFFFGFDPGVTLRERARLEALPISGETFLEHFSLESPDDQGGLNVMLLADTQERLPFYKRFSATNYEGAEQFDGKNMKVLVDPFIMGDDAKRDALFREVASWVQRALNPVGNNGSTQYRLPSGKLVGTPWGLAASNGNKSVHDHKDSRALHERSGSRGVVPGRTPVLVPIVLEDEERQKEALIVAALGAFNYGVAMHLDDEKLHRIYSETIKRLALLAEQASSGAGELLLHLVEEAKIDQLFSDMVIDRLGLGESGITLESPGLLELTPGEFRAELQGVMEYVAPGEEDMHSNLLRQVEDGIQLAFYHLVEALLTFGRSFVDLDVNQRDTSRSYSCVDESKHFARIMDPDLIVMYDDKRVVGVADAGNPRIVRLLSYGADHRKRQGVYTPWPMPGKAMAESASFSNPLSPSAVRRRAPYVGVVVTAPDVALARQLVNIFRRLVIQYPMEMVFAIIEDWLMVGRPEQGVSVTAFQLHREEEQFYLKVIDMGGGGVVIEDGDRQRKMLITFPSSDISVGQLDAQTPLSQKVVLVESGDMITAVSSLGMKEFGVGTDEEQALPHHSVARMRVSNSRCRPVSVFEWDDGHVTNYLDGFFRRVIALEPEIVRIEVGHIHSDRELGPEQETSGLIARVFADELALNGISIDVEPVIDNLHVVDRVDVLEYLAKLSGMFGSPVEKVSFEASLLDRRLADEVIAKLYELCPDKVKFIGHNIYLQVSANTMIELYDGIGPDKGKLGRQGCVPFMGGYEIRRLNPTLANEIFREIIMRDYPESMVAEWWRGSPGLDFEALTMKHVYRENPERRAALKAIMEQEIDRPYRDKVLGGDTSFLDAILASVDVSRQVLVHILETAYDAQHTKFVSFMQCAGMLPMSIFRVSFDRHSGRMNVLDVNK